VTVLSYNSSSRSLWFAKPPKHPVLIHRVGEFEEIHVGDRQVIVDALNRGRDGAKTAPALAAQIDDEDGELRVADGFAVRHEEEEPVAGGHSREQVFLAQVPEFIVFQKLHVGVIKRGARPWNLRGQGPRRSNQVTDSLPRLLILELGADHKGAVAEDEWLHARVFN